MVQRYRRILLIKRGAIPKNSRLELSALRNLSKNKDLVMLRPDKGNGIDIVSKDDYISKLECHLSDAWKVNLRN